ncbi:hypothetical protein FI667_g6827, partial [Globisporangium splendens]
MQHDDHMQLDHDPAASLSQQSDASMDTTADTVLAVDTSAVSSPSSKSSSLARSSRTASPQRRSTAAGKAAQSPSNAASVHQSAKMMDAQGYFQRVVKQELQVLLESGVDREVAVKKLLHRIVESTDEPEPSDVRRVMRQFQMNYDDAVRALIVKQEIGRLKRQGMDAFAAIEELTRKMQRVIVVPPTGETGDQDTTTATEEGDTEGENTRTVTRKRRNSQLIGNNGDGERDRVNVEAKAADRQAESSSSTVENRVASATPSGDSDSITGKTNGRMDAGESTQEGARADAAPQESAAGDAANSEAATADGEENDGSSSSNPNLSPLSLCQRIGNVTISSATKKNSNAHAGGDANAVANERSGSDHSDVDAGLQSPQSRSPPSSSSFSSTPSPFSRKRRGVFGPFMGMDAKDLSSSSSTRSSSSSHNDGTGMLPLFQSSKKQKVKIEVGDSFFSRVSRKSAKTSEITSSPIAGSPRTSNSGSGSGANTSSSGSNNSKAHGSSHSPSMMNPHKRQREPLVSGFEFPVLDDDDAFSVADHMIHHHTKRHKS